MDENTFSEEELKFIQDLKASDLYQRTAALSQAINADAHLTALAKERDALYEKADAETDEEKKRTLLIQAKARNDSLLKDPKIREYLQNYRKIKSLLSDLNEGLLKEVRS
jgi:cell fate (sporulation/competence/biofilm development) regulator YlbF (YheA/YmcA/DUF963 family)